MKQPMVTKIILISAKQGGGKSTLSAEIRKLFSDQMMEGPWNWMSVEMIFAGAIYEMHDYCRKYLTDCGIEVSSQKDGDLLQFLGTEWGRGKYGPDIWVDILRAKIQETIHHAEKTGVNKLLICIPDCRFKNELEVWPGAYRVRLECPEEIRRERCSMWRKNTAHASETDLDDSLHKFDLVLRSDKVSALDLARKVLFELALAGPR
jgi:hypothetical protein